MALAAPPCSLYGPACSSVHKRSRTNVRGDLANFKVRLARRIWTNFVAGLDVLSIRGALHNHSYSFDLVHFLDFKEG